MSGLVGAAGVCARCPSLCAPACPAAIGADRPGLTPRGLMLAAATGDRAALDLCSDCGACAMVCDAGLAPGRLLAARRAELWAAESERAAGGADEPKIAQEPAAALADPTGWRAIAGLRATTMVIARCGCGAPGLPVERWRRALVRVGRGDVVVADGMDCGRRAADAGAWAAFAALGPPVALALAGVRSVVIAGGGCALALQRHVEAMQMAAIYISLVDDWLARFGVALPGRPLRLAPCQRSTPALRADAALSPMWPPAPACCGGQGRLAGAAPRVARAAGAALLRRLEGRPAAALHVADATCAAHLRGIAAAESIDVVIVDRATRWLAELGGDDG